MFDANGWRSCAWRGKNSKETENAVPYRTCTAGGGIEGPSSYTSYHNSGIQT